jgi:hypothetical protein
MSMDSFALMVRTYPWAFLIDWHLEGEGVDDIKNNLADFPRNMERGFHQHVALN